MSYVTRGTIISLDSFRGPVFVIETQYVYCEILTEEFRFRLDKEGLLANSGFLPLSNIPRRIIFSFTYTLYIPKGHKEESWKLSKTNTLSYILEHLTRKYFRFPSRNFLVSTKMFSHFLHYNMSQ